MKNLKLTIGIVIVGAMALLGLLAPFLPIQDPNETHLESLLAGPSSQHWLGQDEEGRDVLARTLYGTRLSLFIGITVVAIAMALGTFLGLLSGYLGGKVDQLFVMVGDVFLAFPSILLIIALAALIPPGVFNIILILGLVGWVSYARLVRSEVLSLKRREYVQAAQSMGFSHLRILFRHLLPNTLNPLIVNATLSLAGVIIAESTLSFLGLGLPPGTASWGSMLDAGVAYLQKAPHLSMAPGFAIMLIVLGFNFLGDGLRDYFDVRQQS